MLSCKVSESVVMALMQMQWLRCIFHGVALILLSCYGSESVVHGSDAVVMPRFRCSCQCSDTVMPLLRCSCHDVAVILLSCKFSESVVMALM